MNWENCSVLVTGGASFIGSHLVDALVTGPLNRVASNELGKKLLGWEPEVKFINGLHKTIDWYFATKSQDHVRSSFNRLLIER